MSDNNTDKKIIMHRDTYKEVAKTYAEKWEKTCAENEKLKKKVIEIRKKAGYIVGTATTILDDNH